MRENDTNVGRFAGIKKQETDKKVTWDGSMEVEVT